MLEGPGLASCKGREGMVMEHQVYGMGNAPACLFEGFLEYSWSTFSFRATVTH